MKSIVDNEVFLKVDFLCQQNPEAMNIKWREPHGFCKTFVSSIKSALKVRDSES